MSDVQLTKDTPEARFPTRGPRAAGEAAPQYDIAPGTAFKRKYLVWIRRFSQVFFLALFFWMVARTEFTGSFTLASEGDETIKLGEPVAGFLWFDPLVAMGTAIASHSLYKELLFALGLLVSTLLVGRFFCGWICPFGTLHQFFSWIAPSRKGKLRIDRNMTLKYQQVKYYILVAMGVAAVFGSLQVGLLDPICVMVRSTGLFVLPAAAHAARAGADVLYESNTGAGIWLGDLINNAVPVVLPAKEYSYHYIWMLGSLFIGFLLMNRFITRFWCRAICPLGALLGVSSRWAIYGMEKDHDKCTDCNLCILHCQGAADPQGGVKWNVSECHLCFNCENLCPDDVITFKFFPRQKSIERLRCT